MKEDRKPRKAEVISKAKELMREGNNLIRTAEILLQGCGSPLATKVGKISEEVNNIYGDFHDAFMRQLSADMKSEIKNAAKEYARKRA